MKREIQLLRGIYEDARDLPGARDLSPDEALRRGIISYLEQPRVTKLRMGGTLEERLDELVLALAQEQAAYGVLRSWDAAEGEEYGASRDEYSKLADELERLEGEVAPQLRAEIGETVRDIVSLEATLRERGGNPEEIEPPFPPGVARPAPPAPPQEEGMLRRLWRRFSGG
jgi:hypothetical protein